MILDSEQSQERMPLAGRGPALTWSRVGAFLRLRELIAARPWLAVCALLVAAGLLHLSRLMAAPAPFVDEAWYASRAVGIIKTGYGFGALDAGVLDRYAGYQHYFWWLGPWLQSLAIRIGGVSLFSLRVESLLFGLAILALTYVIGRRLEGQATGLWAIGIGAVSLPFAFSSHLGRQDTILVTIALSMIALVVSDDGKGLPVKAGIAGLLVGAGLDVHPNIIIFVPVVLALYLVDCGRKSLRSPRLWAFCAGAGVGVAVYLAAHALPILDTYKQIAYIQNGSGHNPPILAPDLWYWAVYGTFWLVGPLTWMAVLVSIIDRILDKSWTAGFLKMQIIFWVLIASFTATILNRPAHYQILLAPPVWLLMASLASRLFRRPWLTSPLTAVRAVVVGVALVLPVTTGVQFLLSNPGAGYETIMARVGSVIPAGKSALGSQIWWFARPDEPYISWEQLIYYQRMVPGSTLKQAFDFLKPDYVIVDSTVESYLVDDTDPFDPATIEYFVNIASSLVNKTEFEGFLNAHGEEIATISQGASNIRIYQLTP